MFGRKRRHRKTLERIARIEVELGLRKPPLSGKWATGLSRVDAAGWMAAAQRESNEHVPTSVDHVSVV